MIINNVGYFIEFENDADNSHLNLNIRFKNIVFVHKKMFS